MNSLRRILSWSLFLGFLWAVGYGVFHFVRYRPRCVIEGPLVVLSLSADGSRLVTAMETAGGNLRGPIQIWDTQNGQVKHVLFDSVKSVQIVESPDHQYVAVIVDDDASAHLVDVLVGEEWPLANTGQVASCQFSPKGRWLTGCNAQMLGLEFAWTIHVPTRRIVLHPALNPPLYSADEELVFGFERDLRLMVWDERTRTKVHADIAATWFVPSPDGKLLVIGRPENGSRLLPDYDSSVTVWDVADSKIRFRRHLSVTGSLSTAFAPDSTKLAFYLNGKVEPSQFEVLDAKTGRLLWSHATTRACLCEFSADGSLCYLVHAVDGANHPMLTVFDACTGHVLWERKIWDGFFAAATGNTVLVRDRNEARVLLLDARTGKVKAQLPLIDAIPNLTPDGRHFVIRGSLIRNRELNFWEKWLEKRRPGLFAREQHIVLVVETNTARELIRVPDTGVQSILLSDDASTLATADTATEPADGVIIRIWDVSPTRAYLWAFGTAAATGIALLGLWRAWRKFKGRAASTKQTPAPSAPP